MNYFLPLSRSVVGAASKTSNADRQMSLLEQTKTLAESALQLMYAAKECGGNPAATEAFAEINDAAGNMTEAVKDLKSTLEMAASEAGLTAGMVNTIAKAAGTVRKYIFNDYLLLIICMKLDDVIGGEVSKSFAEYQESVSVSAKAIMVKAQDMVSGTDVTSL